MTDGNYRQMRGGGVARGRRLQGGFDTQEEKLACFEG